MSGAATWLHGQRKTELVELAEKVGLRDYENLKKSELEMALDEHMRANQTKLVKDNALQPYFKRINNPSPVKREVSLTETKTPRAVRRTTKEPAETAEPTTAAVRSPRTSLSFAAALPLPPSPAVIVDQLDRQSARVRSSVSKVYKQSGLTEFLENARETISSSATIESLVVLIEALSIRSEILPSRNFGTIPASKSLGTKEYQVGVPDLFLTFTAGFWSMFTIWSLMSFVLPALSAYLFNLTVKAKNSSKVTRSSHAAATFDPLTFNITKALLTWLVYSEGYKLAGYPSIHTVGRIQDSLPGGHQGVLIGTGIGILTSIYEAVLKK